MTAATKEKLYMRRGAMAEIDLTNRDSVSAIVSSIWWFAPLLPDWFCFRFVIFQALYQSLLLSCIYVLNNPALRESFLGWRDLDFGCSDRTCYGGAQSWALAAMAGLKPVAAVLGWPGVWDQDLYRSLPHRVSTTSCMIDDGCPAQAAMAGQRWPMGPRRHQRCVREEPEADMAGMLQSSFPGQSSWAPHRVQNKENDFGGLTKSGEKRKSILV